MQRTSQESPADRFTVPDWLMAARGYGMLSRLPDQLVAEVLAQARRVEYPRGLVGLRWDDKPVTGILLRGTARSFLSYPDGGQVTARYLRPGDVVGVFAARLPRISRGLQALEACELLMITADRMRDLSMAQPAFAWALVEEMTTILNLAQRALYLRAFGSVRQRVAVALLDRARLGGKVTSGQTVPGTQAELATGAGTVREVVATVLHGLKRDGMVDVRRGAVVILDPERLAGEADVGFDPLPASRGETTQRAL